MKTKILYILTLLIVSSIIHAQYNEIDCGISHPSLQIMQIDFTEISTLIFIKYTNSGNGFMNIGDKTHLKDKRNSKEFFLLNSINIPLSDEGEPKVHVFDSTDQVHYFCLEFEKIPETIGNFDLIEEENSPNAFNIHDINIHLEKKTDFIKIDDFIKSSPVKEYGFNLRDGNLIYYFKHKGLSISMTLFRDNKYGDYYQAWINIQNFTGRNLLLSPDRIRAKTLIREEIKDLHILSYQEYMKKVNRSQAWQNFAVAFGNSLAASNAGYSASTSNTSVTGVTNSFGTASGYIGNSYGYASGWSSSYSTAYGRSITQSYNGAAAYAAQQNAYAQTNNFIANQFQIKSRLSEGYIKANTLSNQTEFMGYLNIKYLKTDNLIVEIPINGETYIFHREWINK